MRRCLFTSVLLSGSEISGKSVGDVQMIYWRKRGAREDSPSTQISNVIIGVVSNLTSATKSNNISLYTECQTLPYFVISHDIIDCLVSLSSGVRAVTALQLLTPSLTSPSHLSDSEQ